MRAAERAVGVLALVVARPRRSRFLEEWRSDLAAGPSVGVSPTSVLLGAAGVALVLLRLRLRAALGRARRRWEPLCTGVLLGLLLAVTDVPSVILVPVVVLAVAMRARRPRPARSAGARIDAVR